MYRVQTLNQIAAAGLARLPQNRFQVENDAEAPDAILVRSASLHEKELPDSLLAIARAGAGVNNIPLDRCSEQGIVVFNTPGANANAVAELVIGALVSGSRNVPDAVQWAQGLKGSATLAKDVEKGKKQFVGPELRGKTLGVIGLGAIGRETAKICQGVGMKVAGYDPFMSQEKIEALGAEYYADYKELLKVADIVTVHVPLTDQTRDMISAAELATMKKTALVINCSRGGIVNEADLCAALRAGTIAGAGTDVFCNEPPKPDDPLLNTPNLIVSPHSAAQTREAVIKMANMCVDGCLAVIRGEKWPFVADKKVYDHPKWADK